MSEKKINKIPEDVDKREFCRNIIIFVVLVVVAIVILLFPEIKPKETKKVEFSTVKKICELSTLKCYYHDVAEYTDSAKGIFGFGYKKFWIEYDGIVEVGIDINEVQVSEPDKNGVVEIYVPDAKILNVYADENSMTDPIVDTGIFTTITSEDKIAAFAQAQDKMEETAESDASILAQAYYNAKQLLEQYIKSIDNNYTVQWIEPTKTEEPTEE